MQACVDICHLPLSPNSVLLLPLHTGDMRHTLAGGCGPGLCACVHHQDPTALAPHLFVQAICATRFLVGVGQGCVDASIVDTISRWALLHWNEMLAHTVSDIWRHNACS